MRINKLFRQKEPEHPSGVIKLEHDQLIWSYDDRILTTINLRDVVIIGEYTNADGPYLDDWFLTFVTRDGRWQSIPWYAHDIGVLTDYLCQAFQPGLDTSHLNSSTTWNSIVRYPKNLEGVSLFTLKRSAHYRAPSSRFEKFLHALGYGDFNADYDVDLTDEVKEELKRSKSN